MKHNKKEEATVETKDTQFTLPNKRVKIVATGRVKFSNLSSYPKTGTVLTTELGKDRRYRTGLTKEEEAYFEDLFNLEQGDLSRKPVDKKDGRPNRDGSNFWADLEIRFDTKRNNELDLSDPMDYIKYKVLTESTKVCNSVLEKNKWPLADWLIMDEEADSVVEANEIDHQLEASEIFNEMSAEDRKGMLRLYGKKKLEKVKDSLIKATLFKEMMKDPIKFKKLATDKALKTRILLEELLEQGIITRNGNYFKNGDDPIGNSTEEAIAYLDDIKNQSVKISLKGKLK